MVCRMNLILPSYCVFAYHTMLYARRYYACWCPVDRRRTNFASTIACTNMSCSSPLRCQFMGAILYVLPGFALRYSALILFHRTRTFHRCIAALCSMMVGAYRFMLTMRWFVQQWRLMRSAVMQFPADLQHVVCCFVRVCSVRLHQSQCCGVLFPPWRCSDTRMISQHYNLAWVVHC